MNNLHISTSKKLKDCKPTQIRKVGFLKLRKIYEYDFTSPSDYWRAIGRNRDVKAVTGGIMRGGVI